MFAKSAEHADRHGALERRNRRFFPQRYASFASDDGSRLVPPGADAMKDQSAAAHDDAPLTTSKDNGIDEKLACRVPDAEGRALSGVTVTINRPRAELFAYWRDFTNLATFMDNVVQIDQVDAGRSNWVVRAPAGRTVEWYAGVTAEEEGRMIAWASEPGADVPNSGRVDFRDASGGRGTAVTATIAYEPPGGVIGKVIAIMFQREPAIQARRDLRRFKQLMETGEIATAAWTAAQHDEKKD
jgi:uncharacterized membrane protein